LTPSKNLRESIKGVDISNNHSANKKIYVYTKSKVNKIIYIFIFVFVFVMHKNVNENMMNIEFNHYNLCKGQS